MSTRPTSPFVTAVAHFLVPIVLIVAIWYGFSTGHLESAMTWVGYHLADLLLDLRHWLHRQGWTD